MTNVCAVILAHNEAKNLPRTLKILNGFKREGLIQSIVVVDDASTDKTPILARGLGAVVVSHETNLGKREGFITGSAKAKELGAQVMLSLDADIHFFPRESLAEMVGAVSSGKKLMSVAQQYEQCGSEALTAKEVAKNLFSREKISPAGEGLLHVATRFKREKYVLVKNPGSTFPRAINLVALEPLFRKNSKWMAHFRSNTIPDSYKYGSEFGRAFAEKALGRSHLWGLEALLNTLVPKSKQVFLKVPVFSSEPFRIGEGRKSSQHLAKQRIETDLNARSFKAKELVGLRRRIRFAKQKRDADAAAKHSKRLSELRGRKL